jgi:hypothetical protein
MYSGIYPCFGGTRCLHIQGRISQQTGRCIQPNRTLLGCWTRLICGPENGGCSSETSASSYRTTSHYIPEQNTFQSPTWEHVIHRDRPSWFSFFLSPFRETLEQYLHCPMAASFQIPSNSLVMYLQIIPRYPVKTWELLGSVFNIRGPTSSYRKWRRRQRTLLPEGWLFKLWRAVPPQTYKLSCVHCNSMGGTRLRSLELEVHILLRYCHV